MPSTRKAVKVIGTAEYINRETGELEEFQVISIEERDAHFQKLWISHVLDAVEEMGNAKMRIMLHLIAKRHPVTNMLVQTYAEIAEETDTSVRTVITTIQSLVKHDIVRRKRGTTGVLFLNPDVVFKGTRDGRLKVLIEYQDWKSEDIQPKKSEEHVEPEVSEIA